MRYLGIWAQGKAQHHLLEKVVDGSRTADGHCSRQPEAQVPEVLPASAQAINEALL